MYTANFGDREHAWFVYRNMYRFWVNERDHPKPDIQGSVVTFAYEKESDFDRLIKHLQAKKKRVKVKLH
ncbi:hypothetical protein KY309_00845 [Candidatus Woesearchaeota archaeon]|nr:hypothetical protein [Candidatus Woesearchaeota archaeon]